MNRLLVTTILCCALHVDAGVINIQPANPTSTDLITIELTTPYAELELQPVVITGTTIELTFRGAPFVAIGGGATASIGPLPPGTYTIIVRHVVLDEPNGNVVQTITDPPRTLVVAAAHQIPTLQSVGFACLLAALAAAGLIAVKAR